MVRGGAPFGKGDGGIRKNPSLMGKSDANECNESLLSNCRVQLALSKKKDGMILERTPFGQREFQPSSLKRATMIKKLIQTIRFYPKHSQ